MARSDALRASNFLRRVRPGGWSDGSDGFVPGAQILPKMVGAPGRRADRRCHRRDDVPLACHYSIGPALPHRVMGDGDRLFRTRGGFLRVVACRFSVDTRTCWSALSSIWPLPGLPAWSRAPVPDLVDWDLCTCLRGPSPYPCFSIQGNFLESRWGNINRRGRDGESRIHMFHLATSQLTHFLTAYSYRAVLVFVAIESMGIPFSGETMLLVAAIYTGTTHLLSLSLGIIAAVSGAILDDNEDC
jgi:hypothetical protein